MRACGCVFCVLCLPVYQADSYSIYSGDSQQCRYVPPQNTGTIQDTGTSGKSLAKRLYRHFFFFFLFSHVYFPASGQAVVKGVAPSPPRFLPSICIAHRVQQSHCSSIFHRVLLTHALQFPQVNLCAKISPHEFIRVCTWGDWNSRN